MSSNNQTPSRITKLRQSRKGTLSLETALILPIFLITGYFLLSVLIGLRTDLVYRHAVTQWRNESALILSGIDAFAKVADVEVAGMFDFLDEADKDLLRSAITDVGSSVTIGQLFQKRLDYWLGKSAGAAGVIVPAQDRQLILHWQFDDFRLDHELNYELVTPWRRYPRRISGAIPLWMQSHPVSHSEGEEEAEDSDIWSEHVFVRGAYFRDLAEANLPRNFPVYCRYENGTATACRSLDPNAPSYSDTEKVIRQIRHELNRIDNFSGGKVDSSSNDEITPDKIQRKILVLYIPSNTPEYWNTAFEEVLHAEATARGVQLDIRRHGKSRLYEPSQEAP